MFADSNDTALWVGLSNAVTAILVAVGAIVLNWLRTRQEVAAKADAARQETMAKAEIATNDEYRKLVKTYEARVTRLEKRVDSQDDELARLGDQYRSALIREARCCERIGRYEDALKNAGVKFSPFCDDSGSPSDLERNL